MKNMIPLIAASLLAQACLESAFATEPAIQSGSQVDIGVGRPKSYAPASVTTGGSVEVGDGTNPAIFPWGSVVNISCPGLIGTADAVLACFTMNRAGTADVSTGHCSDGTRNAEGHCRWLSAAKPSVDLKLAKDRLFDASGDGTPLPGFLGTKATLGYCGPAAAAAFRGGACTVASEATDCGGASTCIGTTLSVYEKLRQVTGALVQMDSTAAETCYPDADI